MKQRKGIILAGGSGTRLFPITNTISKQLLPIYDKPMIYYPLTVLMLAGIKEILIITTPKDQKQFQQVLGDGSQWGINFSYISQNSPDGLAQAFILAEKFLSGSPSAMILGDNVFYGNSLQKILYKKTMKESGASILGYHVTNPEDYGVVGFDEDGKVTSLVEKPKKPLSNYAITGLYFLDNTAPERAKFVEPSPRGELEITCLLKSYLDEDKLTLEKMGRGFAWLDTGSHKTLLEAGNFIQTISLRQGQQIGSPEEMAYRLGWITSNQLENLAYKYHKSDYGKYLLSIL